MFRIYQRCPFGGVSYVPSLAMALHSDTVSVGDGSEYAHGNAEGAPQSVTAQKCN